MTRPVKVTTRFADSEINLVRFAAAIEGLPIAAYIRRATIRESRWASTASERAAGEREAGVQAVVVGTTDVK